MKFVDQRISRINGQESLFGWKLLFDYFFFVDTIWFIAIIVMDFLEPSLTKDRLDDLFHSHESAFYFIIHLKKIKTRAYEGLFVKWWESRKHIMHNRNNLGNAPIAIGVSFFPFYTGTDTPGKIKRANNIFDAKFLHLRAIELSNPFY